MAGDVSRQPSKEAFFSMQAIIHPLATVKRMRARMRMQIVFMTRGPIVL
jgi:hypothetical protein